MPRSMTSGVGSVRETNMPQNEIEKKISNDVRFYKLIMRMAHDSALKQVEKRIENYISRNKGKNPLPTIEEGVAREVLELLKSLKK